MRMSVILSSSYADYHVWEIDYYVWEQKQLEKTEIIYRHKLLLALRIAMDEYRLSNPEGYELIEDYYLGEKVTHKELGKRHGIAESTAREKLNRNLHRLRKLAYKNLSFLEYVDYEFATYNVQFISIGENFNSENGDRIMMGLFNLINELYAQDISRKQRAAIRAKGESGKHVTTRPIYGYRTDPQDKSHWIIDEDAAEVVRFIFTMYLSGHGFSEIADMLHDKKVLCPSAYRGKIRKGSSAQTDPYTWNGRTIADILSKQEYCGDTVNFRTERKSYKDKRVIFKPDSELVIHQNTQTAIVSRADYEAVQEKLSQKKKYVRNRERPILDGKVFCYDCKCKMYLMRKKQKGGIYNVYVCNNYRKKKNQTCSSHYIPEKTILQELKKLLYQILQEYENDKKTFLRKLRYLLRAKCSSELMAARSECEKVENRIREVSDYKKSAYADKLSKRITDEFFDSIMFSMDEETIQLKSKYEECQHVLCAAEEKIKGADLFCRRLNQFSLESLNEISETAVNSLVDRIEIREENELGKKSVLLDFYLVGIGKILS